MWARRIGAFLFGAAVVIGSEPAWAAADTTQIKQFSLNEIFAFLFLMLGPFKIIGPFLKITDGADTAIARRTALQATAFASAALLIAAVLGELIIVKYGIPLPILTLAAGIILFLVALISILRQFDPSSVAKEENASAPSIRTAMMPLAFPTIVTPYGIAALVLFVAISPNTQNSVLIGGAVLFIMALNLIAMFAARSLQMVLGVVLPVLGAIIGVVQVALGLKIIVNSLRAMGIY